MKAVGHIALAIALVVLASTAPASADNQGGIKIGILNCTEVPGTGVNLLIYSSTEVECVLRSPEGTEKYTGKTGIALGVDLEWSASKAISYAVFGVTNDVRVGNHALAGKYVGVKASATAGVGIGAQVLVGAGPKSITLQPLALEVGSGFGAAAGLAYLSLEPAPTGHVKRGPGLASR